MSADLEFEKLVKVYYRDLYRFGFSLTGSEADAADLTQETFYIWASKGHQLNNPASVKGWLFTTLHREFLKIRLPMCLRFRLGLCSRELRVQRFSFCVG